MPCETCPNFDKENEECNKEISKIADPHCFGKNICWLLAMIHDELSMLNDSWGDGEGWKKP